VEIADESDAAGLILAKCNLDKPENHPLAQQFQVPPSNCPHQLTPLAQQPPETHGFLHAPSERSLPKTLRYVGIFIVVEGRIPAAWKAVLQVSGFPTIRIFKQMYDPKP